MEAAAQCAPVWLSPCPCLPEQEAPLRAECLAALGTSRGADFYIAALHYAQSQWREGLPARAILSLNRAMGCDLAPDAPELRAWPLPYKAVAWILTNYRQEDFIGNPRRHWQHLATRMVGPRAELRTWRAWACWYMACIALPHLPSDDLQLDREGIIEPTLSKIQNALERLGLPGESSLWRSAWHALTPRAHTTLPI